MKLPKKKRENRNMEFPENDSFLVYGAPKSGKTQFASTWPEPLVIDTEDGSDYIEDAYIVKVDNLSDFREIYKELKNQKDDLPYQTIVLDTLDEINKWIEAAVCAEKGIDEMGDAGYGSDWALARNRMLNLIKQFSKLPVNLLLISHAKHAIFENGIDSITIDLPGKLARFVMAFTDNILFTRAREVDGEIKRELILSPSGSLEAGSRNPVIDNAGNCDLTYKSFKSIFSN